MCICRYVFFLPIYYYNKFIINLRKPFNTYVIFKYWYCILYFFINHKYWVLTIHSPDQSRGIHLIYGKHLVRYKCRTRIRLFPIWFLSTVDLSESDNPRCLVYRRREKLQRVNRQFLPYLQWMKTIWIIMRSTLYMHGCLKQK